MMRVPGVAALVAVAFAVLAGAREPSGPAALPDMGPAPEFTLVDQNGERFRLSSLRGKVVAIAFIYTSCPDVCALLTDKMARVRDDLGDAFGSDVAFVSITFDPARDTSDVLRDYAEAFDADTVGWFFLTGDEAVVHSVTAQYGVVAWAGTEGAIDHNLFTTLVDRRGRIRVQYAGYRFDPNEFRRDLIALTAEPR